MNPLILRQAKFQQAQMQRCDEMGDVAFRRQLR
jgi:hypothetical protein